MSEFRVPVVKIGKVGKHPNADSLSITQIDGCPVIFRTEDFREGDLAIYIPVEAVVPETVPGTEFLGKHRRIKAMKLRGVFSMGLLLPLVHDQLPIVSMVGNVGDNVAAELGITKYEEPLPVAMRTDMAPPPKTAYPVPVYDIESHRKYRHVYLPGERVIVTEKLHGTNARFVYIDGQLHCGSHNSWKKQDERSAWWRVAKEYDLDRKLANYPGEVFYGEIYGQVQDLKYGSKPGELKLAIFDIYNSNKGHWLDSDEFCLHLDWVVLPSVPVLYVGPYTDFLDAMCDGNSVASTVPQIREGIVIKPVVERRDNEIGRVITKLVGEQYLTRKDGTEFH